VTSLQLWYLVTHQDQQTELGFMLRARSYMLALTTLAATAASCALLTEPEQARTDMGDAGDMEDVALADMDLGVEEELEPWLDPNWARRIELRLRPEAVPDERTTGLTALVILDRARVDPNEVQKNAEDLRFVAVGGSRLAHEVEVADLEDGGKIAAWVELPAIGPDEPNAIWLYYDNPLVIADERADELWERYEVVHHFSEFDEDGLPQDASGNGLHVLSQSDTLGYAPSGVAGSAPFFVSANGDSLQLGRQSPLHSDPSSQLTITFWFMTPNRVVESSTLMSDEDLCRGWGLGLGSSDQLGAVLGARLFAGEDRRSCDTDTYDNSYRFHYGIPVSKWTHVALTLDRQRARMVLWRDGVEHNDETGDPVTVGQSAVGGALTLGAPKNASNDFFNGFIDEFRVYRGVRSNTWHAMQPLVGSDRLFDFGDPERVPAP